MGGYSKDIQVTIQCLKKERAGSDVEKVMVAQEAYYELLDGFYEVKMKRATRTAKTAPAKKSEKKPKVAKTPRVKKVKKAPKTVKLTVAKKRVGKTGKKTSAKKRVTNIDTIVGLIKGAPEGISTAELKTKTGFADTKIWNIITRATKQGKVRTLKRGVYGGVTAAEASPVEKTELKTI